MLYFKSVYWEFWEMLIVIYLWIIIGWSLCFDVFVIILLIMYFILSVGRFKLFYILERECDLCIGGIYILFFDLIDFVF